MDRLTFRFCINDFFHDPLFLNAAQAIATNPVSALDFDLFAGLGDVNAVMKGFVEILFALLIQGVPMLRETPWQLDGLSQV